ncbi:hypothetical protein SADUNF_Sadunf06G0194400 [Salix dunnii]|uniref:Uncharacterized protein n=1 Tax=Salix dunnii TaxID=1413687 RepID=A0A835MY05_9ROSI|nr:hypothetical protein SADUNF_Sadunf06G0194400 [Salix dunnii]
MMTMMAAAVRRGGSETLVTGSQTQRCQMKMMGMILLLSPTTSSLLSSNHFNTISSSSSSSSKDLFSNEENLALKEYPGLCKVRHGEKREKSTMLLVTEARRATGMTKEASGTLVTSDHKGSPPTLRKGRMVLRDDFQCMLMACHKNMSPPHSCKFGCCGMSSCKSHGPCGSSAATVFMKAWIAVIASQDFAPLRSENVKHACSSFLVVIMAYTLCRAI